MWNTAGMRMTSVSRASPLGRRQISECSPSAAANASLSVAPQMSQPAVPAPASAVASASSVDLLAPRRGPTRAELYGSKPAAAASLRGSPPQTAAVAPAVASASPHGGGVGRWERGGSDSSDRNRYNERDCDQTGRRSQRSDGTGGGAGRAAGYREARGDEHGGYNARRNGQRAVHGGPSASSSSALSASAAGLAASFSSLHLAAPAVPAVRPAPLLSHVSPAARGRYAYVFLVMKGDSYAVGAITCAYSLKLTGTRHSLVCMVTPDVSPSCRSTMRSVFDDVVEVPYLEYRVKPLRTQKQQSMYNPWVESAFTKWNMLSLVSFEKTLFVDADKIVLRNIDHLFEECQAPAGTFSSPWSKPFVERKEAFARANGGTTRSRGKSKAKQGMPNPYADCIHTSRVTSTMISRALHSQSFVVIGTMVLLSPSLEDYEHYKRMLQQMEPFGFEECHSMMDEQSLSYYFGVRKNELIQAGRYGRDTAGAAAVADAAVPASSSAVAAPIAAPSSLPSSAVSEWTYIHQQYNFVPWHRYWLSSSPAPQPAATPAAVGDAAAAGSASAAPPSSSPSAPSSLAAAASSIEVEMEVPYVFHFFNTKPWAQDRAAYLDLESWWEVALVMLSPHSDVSEQQREKLRALYDPAQLALDKIRGCCWCRATLEQHGKSSDDSWKSHNIFDGRGRTECPELIKGFERDEARRRGKAAAPADAATAAS